MSGAPLIAAYKGPAGPDVLRLAKAWSQGSGRPLQVVTVYPGRFPIGMGRTDAEWVSYNRQEAEELLDEARTFLTPEVPAEFRPVAAQSASGGLHQIMAEGGPESAVIVGSRKTRGVRRTALGSTAGRLLQGAPGPVALVPWDYDAAPADPIRRIGVAFVDTPDGHSALAAGVAMATELLASLHVITVVPDTRVTPSLGEPHRYAEEVRAAFAQAIEQTLGELDPSLHAESRVLDGPVVDALADIRPEDIDVLVCGSRGYGPARSVLLGGVSSRLLRHARVPVVVVPRG